MNAELTEAERAGLLALALLAVLAVLVLAAVAVRVLWDVDLFAPGRWLVDEFTR